MIYPQNLHTPSDISETPPPKKKILKFKILNPPKMAPYKIMLFQIKHDFVLTRSNVVDAQPDLSLLSI